MTIKEIAAIKPVFITKSRKVRFNEVPMMMFGGSPHIVAEPPKFAQKISAKTMLSGLNFSILESSTVTAARKRITVIESMNIARTNEISMKEIKIGIILYFTAFAMHIQSHLKNPTLAIPSTIIIIPTIKRIVAQFTPPDSDSPVEYQKFRVKIP